MSRCFPYPPPGYVKKVSHDEALIESIKLQREKEKTKRDRKEKKREKKEKKKAREDGKFENKRHNPKRRHSDEGRIEDKKGRDHHKKIENEAIHLEKSTVTEEHGNPVGSQNSFDSTLNSNKRLKQSLPHDSMHNSGSVFWIRLPSKRHKDPEVLPSKKQPSSASGMHDGTFARGVLEPPPRTNSEQGKQSCSTSRNVGEPINVSVSKETTWPSFGVEVSARNVGEPITGSVSKEMTFPSFGVQEVSTCEVETSADMLCRSCPPAVASKLRDLVENWIPQPLQLELADSGDQDWLSVTKQHDNSERKSCKVGSDDSIIGNSTSCPRACYLSEAGIYALPFTIPF